MKMLSEAYKGIIAEVVKLAKSQNLSVTEDNVYQKANKELLLHIDKMFDEIALPGSGVYGMENLNALLKKANEGASCLLLLEHYSNFDLPAFSYLLRQEAMGGKELEDALVAIAGLKLNADPIVSAFTAAYSRLVIYPSRSLWHLDPEKDRDEINLGRAINRASMKALNELKTQGKLVLVFPAGTRYRPWEPSTKRGVREIDTYIRSFDYMCLVAVNGELLKVREGNMMDDYISPDILQYTAGPVTSTADFRANHRAEAEANDIEDKKQAVVDAIMNELEIMHNNVEIERKKLLEER
ncbi:MAG: 1-acyl-sn-glycerol-3-phosphate acyltransferase [Treponema sp.]|nr:1-acyl-sn-glycerol-3-phosphate acyltransferase [Treponema sp.]